MFNKSIMSKVMGKIFSPIVSSLETSEISRYFTTFNSLFNVYGEFSSPVTLAGDFRISFDFSVPTGTNSTFLGGSDDFNNRIFINGGEVNGVVGGASLFDSRVPVADSSAFNSVVVQRVGVGITITVNGVTGAVKNSGNAFVIDYVGRVNTSYSDGIIANLQIEDNGTLVVDSPIDGAYSPTSNVIRNDAAVLGGELWSSPSLVGSFTDNGDGFFAKVTGGGGELQKTGQGISNGDAFIVKGFIDGLGVGDSLAIQAGGAPTDGRARVSVSDNGSFEVMVIVETDSFDALRVVASGVDVAFTISNISWRQIPTSTPYITLQNSAADGSSSASYTFDAGENRWEGVDAWVNPVVGSQWVDNMDGSYTLAGDGSSNQLRQEDLNLATYEVSWTVDAIDNAMKVQGFDNAPYLFSTTGGDSFVSFCSGGNLNFDRAGSNVVNATISNISIKQILELP